MSIADDVLDLQERSYNSEFGSDEHRALSDQFYATLDENTVYKEEVYGLTDDTPGWEWSIVAFNDASVLGVNPSGDYVSLDYVETWEDDIPDRDIILAARDEALAAVQGLSEPPVSTIEPREVTVVPGERYLFNDATPENAYSDVTGTLHIPAESLPDGWEWLEYGDGSGHLESPYGDSYFAFSQYDEEDYDFQPLKGERNTYRNPLVADLENDIKEQILPAIEEYLKLEKEFPQVYFPRLDKASWYSVNTDKPFIALNNGFFMPTDTFRSLMTQLETYQPRALASEIVNMINNDRNVLKFKGMEIPREEFSNSMLYRSKFEPNELKPLNRWEAGRNLLREIIAVDKQDSSIAATVANLSREMNDAWDYSDTLGAQEAAEKLSEFTEDVARIEPVEGKDSWNIYLFEDKSFAVQDTQGDFLRFSRLSDRDKNLVNASLTKSAYAIIDKQSEGLHDERSTTMAQAQEQNNEGRDGIFITIPAKISKDTASVSDVWYTKNDAGENDKAMRTITLPRGCTHDGNDLAFYRFSVTDNQLDPAGQKYQNTHSVLLPEVNAKTGEPWEVPLSRTSGHRGEDGKFVVDDKKTYTLTSTDLKEVYAQQYEGYKKWREEHSKDKAQEKAQAKEEFSLESEARDMSAASEALAQDSNDAPADRDAR